MVSVTDVVLSAAEAETEPVYQLDKVVSRKFTSGLFVASVTVVFLRNDELASLFSWRLPQNKLLLFAGWNVDLVQPQSLT